MNPWNETHLQLQDAMKKEIETMREILGNMKEEEHFLVHKDKAAWHLYGRRKDPASQPAHRSSKMRTKASLSSTTNGPSPERNELRSLEEILPTGR